MGGLVIGATVKLLGLDAFSLLVGQLPGEITGALEGLLIGGGTGVGDGFRAGRRRSAEARCRRRFAAAVQGSPSRFSAGG